MTDRERYRRTDRTQDVGFVFGALTAAALPGPVLVQMLTRLHMSESSARNTLARMVRQRVLVAEPTGRITVYSLPPGVLEKFRQIEGSAAAPAWTGEFDALIYRAPESVRWFRDRLQYFAAYFGYGMLRPGVLIGVRDRAEDLLAQFGEVPGSVVVHHASLRPADPEEARAMAAIAWDMDAIRADYRRVSGVIEDVLRTSGELPADDDGRWEAYRTWNRLYRDVIELQMRDPHLPTELLPEGWPRAHHMERLDLLNARWGPPLTAFLREQAEPGSRELARYEERWGA